MTAPIERGRYWVFDEEQLTEALAEWQSSDPEQQLVDNERGSVRNFLNSDHLSERGMRRGGED